MARFWVVPVFCNEVWTVWSAYATADYPARPGRPHGQTYQHKSPLDDGEIFLYSRSWLVLDKGIRQKSTKTVRSIVVCSAFCPGSPKRDPLDSEKMACLPEYEFLEYSRKTCIHVTRFTVGKRFACIHVNRRKVVKKKVWNNRLLHTDSYSNPRWLQTLLSMNVPIPKSY